MFGVSPRGDRGRGAGRASAVARGRASPRGWRRGTATGATLPSERRPCQTRPIRCYEGATTVCTGRFGDQCAGLPLCLCAADYLQTLVASASTCAVTDAL